MWSHTEKAWYCTQSMLSSAERSLEKRIPWKIYIDRAHKARTVQEMAHLMLWILLRAHPKMPPRMHSRIYRISPFSLGHMDGEHQLDNQFLQRPQLWLYLALPLVLFEAAAGVLAAWSRVQPSQSLVDNNHFLVNNEQCTVWSNISRFWHSFSMKHALRKSELYSQFCRTAGEKQI